MTSRINRRTLVGNATVLGAGAALAGTLGARAQATPEASPMASPAAAMDADFVAAQDALIAELQAGSGKKLKILSAVVGGKTPEEDALFAEEITRLTGIEVELVHPTADYDQKLLADLAAGVEYDLIYTNQDTVETLVADRKCSPTSPRGSPVPPFSPTPPLSRPTSGRWWSIDGKKYSRLPEVRRLPHDHHPPGLAGQAGPGNAEDPR